jgi:hypothetical protein
VPGNRSIERVCLSIHSSNNAPDIAKKKGVILHGVEGKTRGIVKCLRLQESILARRVNGIFLYLTQGWFSREKLEVINIRSPFVRALR